MSKRQERVSIAQISAFLNRQVNVIMRSGAVHFVTLISTQKDILKVENTRGSKMMIPLSEIADIWAENKAIQ